MKIIIITSVLLTAASGAAFERRQVQLSGLSRLLSSFGSNIQNVIVPASKPYKIENIAPHLRAGAKRQYIVHGPLTLPASKVC
jgi:hypothetical protein